MEWTNKQESFLFVPTGEKLAELIVNMLGIEQEECYLKPCLFCDYVLDTSCLTSQEAALSMKNALLKFSGNTVFFKNTVDLLVS